MPPPCPKRNKVSVNTTLQHVLPKPRTPFHAAYEFDTRNQAIYWLGWQTQTKAEIEHVVFSKFPLVVGPCPGFAQVYL